MELTEDAIRSMADYDQAAVDPHNEIEFMSVLDGGGSEAELHSGLDLGSRAKAHRKDEVLKLKDDNTLLRRRLQRRNRLLDAIRSAYLRDVVAIKEQVFKLEQATGEPEDGQVDEDLVGSLPSLDLRPWFALFAPEECTFHVTPDEDGGKIEIVHKEAELIRLLRQRLADLEATEAEWRKLAIQKEAEAKESTEALQAAKQINVDDRSILCMELLEVKGRLAKLDESKFEQQAKQLSAAQRRIRELELQLAKTDDVEEDLRKLEKERDNAFFEVEQRKEELADMKQENDAVAAKLERAEGEWQSYKAKSVVVGAQLDKTREDLKECQDALAQATDKSGRLQTLLDNSRQSEATMKHTIMEMETQHNESMKSEEAAMEQMEEQCERARDMARDAADQAKSLQKELEKAEQHTQQAVMEASAKLEQKHAKEVKKLKDKHQKSLQEAKEAGAAEANEVHSQQSAKMAEDSATLDSAGFDSSTVDTGPDGAPLDLKTKYQLLLSKYKELESDTVRAKQEKARQRRESRASIMSKQLKIDKVPRLPIGDTIDEEQNVRQELEHTRKQLQELTESTQELVEAIEEQEEENARLEQSVQKARGSLHHIEFEVAQIVDELRNLEDVEGDELNEALNLYTEELLDVVGTLESHEDDEVAAGLIKPNQRRLSDWKEGKLDNPRRSRRPRSHVPGTGDGQVSLDAVDEGAAQMPDDSNAAERAKYLGKQWRGSVMESKMQDQEQKKHAQQIQALEALLESARKLNKAQQDEINDLKTKLEMTKKSLQEALVNGAGNTLTVDPLEEMKKIEAQAKKEAEHRKLLAEAQAQTKAAKDELQNAQLEAADMVAEYRERCVSFTVLGCKWIQRIKLLECPSSPEPFPSEELEEYAENFNVLEAQLEQVEDADENDQLDLAIDLTIHSLTQMLEELVTDYQSQKQVATESADITKEVWENAKVDLKSLADLRDNLKQELDTLKAQVSADAEDTDKAIREYRKQKAKDSVIQSKLRTDIEKLEKKLEERDAQLASMDSLRERCERLHMSLEEGAQEVLAGVKRCQQLEGKLQESEDQMEGFIAALRKAKAQEAEEAERARQEFASHLAADKARREARGTVGTQTVVKRFSESGTQTQFKTPDMSLRQTNAVEMYPQPRTVLRDPVVTVASFVTNSSRPRTSLHLRRTLAHQQAHTQRFVDSMFGERVNRASLQLSPLADPPLNRPPSPDISLTPRPVKHRSVGTATAGLDRIRHARVVGATEPGTFAVSLP